MPPPEEDNRKTKIPSNTASGGPEDIKKGSPPGST